MKKSDTKQIPKFDNKKASAIYNIGKKLGLNDTATKALMGVSHVETYDAGNKNVTGGVWDYKTTQMTADDTDRVVNHGLFSFENLRRTKDHEKSKLIKEKSPFVNYVEDAKMPLGKYKAWLKTENLIDSPEAQIGYYLTKYRSSKKGKSLEDINKLNLNDAITEFNRLQGHNSTSANKQALDRSSNLNDFKPIPDYIGEDDLNSDDEIIKFKKYGGMIKDVTTLKPRKRKYAKGGQMAIRDRFGDVQGNSYGAEKGIQGETVKNTSTTAGSIGGLAGAGVAAFAPTLSTSIATAIGGAAAGAAAGSVVPLLGTAAGALIGGLVGIFTGRKKKRQAKAEAEKADRQRQIIAGNNEILNDELALSNTAQHEGSMDFYGDSNLENVQATQDPQNLQTTIGASQQGSLFGGYQRYAKCGGKVKKRKYDAGGQIQETSSNTSEVVGPSHEQGGVQYNSEAEVEGGESIMTDANSAFVFSDTLKYKGQTFADISKPLMQHKGYLEKSIPVKSMMLGRALSLTDRSTYAIDRNTNSRNSEKANLDLKNTTSQIDQIQKSLTELYNLQEDMKAKSGMDSEPKESYENGGQIENSNNSFIQLSNDRTFIEPQSQPPITLQGMRCGGKTKKMALGGLLSSPYAGLAIEGGMNLIGGLGNYFGNRANLKRMDAMPVPQKGMEKAVNLEWDINTDSEIGDINSMVKGMEKYISSNTSNSQVARQSMLLARTQGSRLRGRVKQQEHNQELQVRNQGRMANAEIAARNLQTSEDNAAAIYNQKMEGITRKSQNSAALSGLISSVGRTIGTGIQTKFDMQNMQMSKLIELMGNDKSRDFILDNLDDSSILSAYGNKGLEISSKLKRKKDMNSMVNLKKVIKPNNKGITNKALNYELAKTN